MSGSCTPRLNRPEEHEAQEPERQARRRIYDQIQDHITIDHSSLPGCRLPNAEPEPEFSSRLFSWRLEGAGKPGICR